MSNAPEVLLIQDLQTDHENVRSLFLHPHHFGAGALSCIFSLQSDDLLHLERAAGFDACAALADVNGRAAFGHFRGNHADADSTRDASTEPRGAAGPFVELGRGFGKGDELFSQLRV